MTVERLRAIRVEQRRVMRRIPAEAEEIFEAELVPDVREQGGSRDPRPPPLVVPAQYGQAQYGQRRPATKRLRVNRSTP